MSLRFGKITDVDHTKGLVKVTFDEDNIVSDWIPAVLPNTKDTKFSFPLSIDERVSCLMDEHADRGVVLGAIYSKKTSPAIVDGKYGVEFPDGTKVEFDPESGDLMVDAQGTVTVKAAPKVVIDCDLEVKGKIEATGAIKSDAQVTAFASGAFVNLSTHIHPTPAGPSSPPSPST